MLIREVNPLFGQIYVAVSVNVDLPGNLGEVEFEELVIVFVLNIVAVVKIALGKQPARNGNFILLQRSSYGFVGTHRFLDIFIGYGRSTLIWVEIGVAFNLRRRVRIHIYLFTLNVLYSFRSNLKVRSRRRQGPKCHAKPRS